MGCNVIALNDRAMPTSQSASAFNIEKQQQAHSRRIGRSLAHLRRCVSPDFLLNFNLIERLSFNYKQKAEKWESACNVFIYTYMSVFYFWSVELDTFLAFLLYTVNN